jgi:hypothetical protein
MEELEWSHVHQIAECKDGKVEESFERNRKLQLEMSEMTAEMRKR